MILGGKGGEITNVVIIIEELGFWGVFGGETESNWDESFTDGVVKDALAVGSILVQCYCTKHSLACRWWISAVGNTYPR